MILSAKAVPYWVPTRFLLVGIASLAASATALALNPHLLLGHYALPAVLAVVHTLTLGFAAATLIGAMHQLMPVVMVTSLHSARLGTLSFGLFLPGTLGVIAGFWAGYRVWLLAGGGILVVSGLLVFAYNVWLTRRASTMRDAVSTAMLSASGYLVATAALGVVIALSRRIPDLATVVGNPTLLHLGLGLFGTFFLAIAGAGHKLLGMFVLSHGVSQHRLRFLIWAVHLGLALVALEVFTEFSLLPFAGSSLALAIILFIVDVTAILRKRVRRKLSPALRLFVLAPLFLLAAALLAATGQGPAAVASLLLGFIGLAVAGMFGKILGFLTWQQRYGALVGKERVPLLNELPIKWLDRVSFWSLALAVPLLVSTQVWGDLAVATVGSLAFSAGAWSLVAQAVWIVFGRHSSEAATSEPVTARGGV